MSVSYSQDVRCYGTVYTDEDPDYGVKLSQAIIHDYTNHYCRLGNPPLEGYSDFIGYVGVIMESIDGFAALSEAARNHVMLSGIGLLGNYIDTVERRFGEHHRVDVYSSETHPAPVSLLLVV